MKIKKNNKRMFFWIFAFTAVFYCQVFGGHTARVLTVSGKAEVRKAQTTDWVFIKTGQALFDNDMIRTYASSQTEIGYADGSKVILRENSQVLINASKTKNRRTGSKHITALYGAAFFLIEEAMPSRTVYRVFTPTAAVSIRGTSFGIVVDKKTGETDVDVINGTVLVKNILLPEELYVKGGRQTKITLNQKPTLPRAIPQQRITELKKWVGELTLGTEQQNQVKRDRRTKVITGTKAEDRIVVSTLIDASGYSGSWDIAKGMSTMIAEMLKTQSNSDIRVINEPGLDPDELGRRENAKLVISGEIEQIELTKQAEISVEADQYKEFYKASVSLVIYIVDPLAGSVIKTIEISEEIRGDDVPQNDWKAVSQQAFNMKNEKFRTGILGKAIARSFERIRLELSEYL